MRPVRPVSRLFTSAWIAEAIALGEHLFIVQLLPLLKNKHTNQLNLTLANFCGIVSLFGSKQNRLVNVFWSGEFKLRSEYPNHRMP